MLVALTNNEQFKSNRAVYRPGLSVEPGHRYSDEPYLSDGLANTFKQAIKQANDPIIKHLHIDDKKAIHKSSSLWKIEADKQWLINQGWYRGAPDNRDLATIKREAQETINYCKTLKTFRHDINDGEFTTSLFFYATGQESYVNMELSFSHATLSVARNNIMSGYANIPLKIMADYVQKEPKLSIEPEMLDRANTIIDICGLQKLEGKILEYIGEIGNNSKADDWLKDPFLIDYRHQQFNFSAYEDWGYFPRFSKNQRKRYIYDA